MPNANRTKPPHPLQRLVRRILKWVRRRVGLEINTPPGTLEGVNDRATLWRVNSTEPGVAACWWICHENSIADLVISVVSLAQLREDLALLKGHRYRRNSDPVRIAGRKPFAQELDEYLESAGGLDSRHITHIFVAAWRAKSPTYLGKDDNGSDRRCYSVRPLCAIPGDFTGATFAWGDGNRIVLKICEVITKRLLRLEEPWEQLINKINWLEWLEFYAQRALGQNHVLQPRR